MTQRTVITGAAGGIGACLARRLGASGARLHLIDLEEARLKALAAELPDATYAASTLDTPQVCAAALPKGEIFALVHLAGIFVGHEMGPQARAAYDTILQNNATNAFDLVSAALPRIVDGGRIVLASSLAFNRGAPEYAAYAMAKGAIVGLTRSLSRQVGARAITVNALAPGIIETPMADDLIKTRGRERVIAGIPLKRLGQPEDVAGPVSFLLSKDAAYITGQVINIDGGVANG